MNRISGDVKSPTVELILPRAGTRVFDEAVLEAFPWDDNGIARVEFLVDGRPALEGLTAYEPPWNVTWDCRSELLGRHLIQAVAYDNSGKRGLSQAVVVLRADSSERPLQDTVRFFDPASAGDVTWRLPDSLGRFTGYGVRFTIGRPATLRRLFIRLHKKFEIRGQDTTAWQGTELFFTINNSVRGEPAEVLDTLTFVGQDMRLVGGETIVWYRIRPRSLQLPREFFVLTTLAPGATGDTLGIMSDGGRYRTYHGMVQENGSWRTFSAGSQISFNPMIYVVVEY